MLKKSLEFAVSSEHGILQKNAESALANRQCIAWSERMKCHHICVTIVNVTNLKIVKSAVYTCMVTQCFINGSNHPHRFLDIQVDLEI